jgi:ABC transporter DrrB family efflux protein
MSRHNPLLQLMLARFREFYREPEVIFWVYGFPVLLAVGLGIAFANREPEPPVVDVQETPELSLAPTSQVNHPEGAARLSAPDLLEKLQKNSIHAELHDAAACRQRYFTGKTALYVIQGPGGYKYVYDPTRPESLLARSRVEEVVLRHEAGVQTAQPAADAHAGGKEDVHQWRAGKTTWQTSDALTTEPGNRYIDFLLPGLMGMNLMGGGFWGVGFVLVDMRVRKLLKRLLATPMRRDSFLLSILGSRMGFMLPEMVVLVLLGRFGFGVPIVGSVLTLIIVILLGALAFSGLGLLIACRTSKTETVSGLMNLAMLPQWLLSGIFFSSKRFPDVMQPFIQALPLTQLNDALREVMLEGASLAAIGWRLTILAAWGLVGFVLALKWFRWQ